MIGRDIGGRTVDGYETTFAVNHLAHYLLLRLLFDRLSHGAIVVMTTSGTHDPAEGTGLPTPEHADARRLADPDRVKGRKRSVTAGRRAYSASKLCNVMTVRTLSGRPETRGRAIVPIAFCPGGTPGTGLVRNLSLPRRIGWRLLGGSLPIRPSRFNRVDTAGEALSDLALGVIVPEGGEYYAALRAGHLVWKSPSELARRDDLAEALWNDSAELVGL
ncbi:MAG: dehydrogenase [Acidimicrobiales bacterium]